jgi:hypothetical protein
VVYCKTKRRLKNKTKLQWVLYVEKELTNIDKEKFEIIFPPVFFCIITISRQCLHGKRQRRQFFAATQGWIQQGFSRGVLGEQASVYL